MDVCVVRYRSDESRIAPGLRPRDTLSVHDNTHVNIGFAAGANAAATLGVQRLICFVNPDGILTSDCLDTLENQMTDPTVVACEPDIPGWNRAPLPTGDMDWLSGACLVVDREAFRQVGGFDARLFMYGEDVDLSYKLAALGRLVHVADARFEHPVNASPPFVGLHRNFRNHLVVQKRHRHAEPGRMARDGLYALRTGNVRLAAARLSGTADYLLRAQNWA